MLEKDSVEKFQEIYKQETGNEIAYQEALIMAEQIIELVRLVYHPIKRTDYEKWKKSE
ncbi:MAG: hypothetical protein ACD_7C00280G0003 [uncultured bacterium]|nr:MAG: hypothetical protein ACD_7C00280G0003 [uncultured bacterium]